MIFVVGKGTTKYLLITVSITASFLYPSGMYHNFLLPQIIQVIT